MLASWEFDRSKQRENIMKPGVTEVFSDTFEPVRRRDGPVKICQATQGCPQVPPLMARRLRDNLPESISAFPSTSITVTFDPRAQQTTSAFASRTSRNRNDQLFDGKLRSTTATAGQPRGNVCARISRTRSFDEGFVCQFQHSQTLGQSGQLLPLHSVTCLPCY